MDLTISPARIQQNRSQTQNFGALKLIVLKHPEASIYGDRRRDEAIDVFSARAEEAASELKINTDGLSEKGFAMEVVPKFRSSSKARVSLVDSTREVVTYGRKAKPISVNISGLERNGRRYGVAIKAAEDFVNMIREAGLGVEGVVTKAKQSARGSRAAKAAKKLGRGLKK